MNPQDEKLWSTLIHLSPLVAGISVARSSDRSSAIWCSGPRAVRARALRAGAELPADHVDRLRIGAMLSSSSSASSSCGRLGVDRRVQHPRGRRCQPGSLLHVPAQHQVRQLGSGQQATHHRIRQQPPPQGEHEPPPSAARPSTSPSAISPATTGRATASRVSKGSPRRSGCRAARSRRCASRVEGLASGGRGDPGGEALGVGGGCLTFHQRTPPTWLCAPGPCPPVLPRPVGEVVPRAVRCSRAQLLTSYQSNPAAVSVARPARTCRPGGRRPVRHLARGDLAGELGAGLDDERVGAEVVGLLGDREVERRLPVGERLPRRAVDEVEADLEAGGARPRDDQREPLRSWVRSSVASTCGTADCMPKLTRVKPAPASSARRPHRPSRGSPRW